MIPAAFDYARPGTLDEALRLLRDHDGEAKVLAGGHSLIPLLRYRLAQPGLLVDIGGLADLTYVRREGGEVRIGARTTHHDLETSALISATSGMWSDTAAGIGDPQVRNWGTIGGSLAHADPSSDWPAVLIACRGSLVLRSAAGERVIAAREFFLDTFVTAIDAAELLMEVRFPVPPARSGGAYEKLERKAGDFATAAAAVQVTLGADGTIAAAGLALTAVADTPFAVDAAESALVGARPSAELEATVRQACSTGSHPVRDSHGPVDYKRAMAGEMAVRALRRALARASA